MLKLGKIYYNGELVNHVNVDYVDYIDTKAVDTKLEIDKPTLVVGWNHLKELNPTLIPSILNKTIVTKKFFWEYSFEENKHAHIVGVEDFVINLPENYFTSQFTYANIDPVFFAIESVSELMNILPKDNLFMYNYKNEMLYLLYMNKITGIDLKAYAYFDFNVDTIKEKLLERSVGYVDDQTGEEYQKIATQFPLFDNLKRYTVVFLSNR